MPYYPSAKKDDGASEQYETPSYWRHLVAEYTGLSFHEVGQLNYVTYLQHRRDAYITRLRRTSAGQEYLEDAWRLEQTEPDRAALRKKFGRKGAKSSV